MSQLVNAETGEIVPSLAECEAVIERGLRTFVEVGEALIKIRDAKLFRQDFDTFETYCKERWGFDRTYASKLISAAQITKAVRAEAARVLPIGNKPDARPVPAVPKNEAQARALKPLAGDPKAMLRAARETARLAAQANRGPIAADFEQAVEAERPTPAKPSGDVLYRKDALMALRKANHLLGLDPARIVATSTADDRIKWGVAARELADLAAALEAALYPGLEVVR